MRLSSTPTSQPFYTGARALHHDPVVQSIQFEALIFGLLQALQHHVYEVHVWGYKASSMLEPVQLLSQRIRMQPASCTTVHLDRAAARAACCALQSDFVYEDITFVLVHHNDHVHMLSSSLRRGMSASHWQKPEDTLVLVLRCCTRATLTEYSKRCAAAFALTLTAMACNVQLRSSTPPNITSAPLRARYVAAKKMLKLFRVAELKLGDHGSDVMAALRQQALKAIASMEPTYAGSHLQLAESTYQVRAGLHAGH